jgi:hypothetical protein
MVWWRVGGGLQEVAQGWEREIECGTKAACDGREREWQKPNGGVPVAWEKAAVDGMWMAGQQWNLECAPLRGPGSR